MQPMREVTVRTDSGKFAQTITSGPHTLAADEKAEQGGDDKGLEPHEFVLAGLGACTSMTLKMYADRKEWPLQSVEVTLTGERGERDYKITRRITLTGPLDEEQRKRLLEIANKCPVHKTLSGTITIDSSLS